MELKQKLPQLINKTPSNSHEGILSYAKVCSKLIYPRPNNYDCLFKTAILSNQLGVITKIPNSKMVSVYRFLIF